MEKGSKFESLSDKSVRGTEANLQRSYRREFNRCRDKVRTATRNFFTAASILGGREVDAVVDEIDVLRRDVQERSDV